jgi:hypothetical protein
MNSQTNPLNKNGIRFRKGGKPNGWRLKPLK